MNGTIQSTGAEHGDKPISRPDLLAHKYRPDSVDKFRCHSEQAQKLKQWIRDFSDAAKNSQLATKTLRDDDEDSGSDTSEVLVEVARKCVLLTGPPGVGKTSLVYAAAKELNMHVVESHCSEKRDFKLFSTLKLANQKGKINPIARMFQAAQEKQQQQQHLANSKRKRRKLDELQQSANITGPATQVSNQCLSLSGDSSIVLFDDIDVVFEEDGPFLKSLVEFVRDSKRPVVLTATQSIDFIKSILIHFEHIHLGTPMIDECTLVLKDICRKERLPKLAKVAPCRSVARKMNCDIRQCLNRIHFYGELAASEVMDDDTDIANIEPDLTSLSAFLSEADSIIAQHEGEDDTRDSERTECNHSLEDKFSNVLSCYSSSSLADLMDSEFNFLDRRSLLGRWLDGKPSLRNEDHGFCHELGDQIKRSIVESTRKLCASEMINLDELLNQQRKNEAIKQAAMSMGQTINSRIKSRIEPPEVEFYTDIVAQLGTAIQLEAKRRQQLPGNQGAAYLTGSPSTGSRSPLSSGGCELPLTMSRRTRRVQSYLDSIGLYLEPAEFALICEFLLTPERLPGAEQEPDE